MKKISVLTLVSAFVIFLGLNGINGAQGQTATFSDGMLVKSQVSGEVFLIDGGLKRLIASPEAFNAQGFNWGAIIEVSADELEQYARGEQIYAESKVVLPLERGNLPDIAPFAPYDLRYATANGRQVVRFTADFWNKGASAFELRSRTNEPTGKPNHYFAYQRIVHNDGSIRDRRVGELFLHDTHDHMHYEDFGLYTISLVKSLNGADGSGVNPNMIKKTTFCMIDTFRSSLNPDGQPQPKTYSGCSRASQGVSVGWVDSYNFDLPEQFVEVQGFPHGIYKISFDLDPASHFLETRKDNNIASTFVELNPSTGVLRVLGATSSFAAPQNIYPEGTLIKSTISPKVYLIHQGKRRHVPNEEIFYLYGYDFSDVWEVSQAEVDAIPYTRIIRVEGRPEIYTLSPEGYTRHVLNPEVFTSYRFTSTEIAEVSEEEFFLYPRTELIVKAGTDRVFSTESKKFIGRLSEIASLGYNRESVHLVNETDFNSYTVKVMAQGLDTPWDIAFLPGGDMLVTERKGSLRRIGSGGSTELAIGGVEEIGEGGLMGIAVHQNFASNSFIYLYFTTSDNGRTNKIIRYRLEATGLVQDKVIMENIPAAQFHDGGQIEFGPDGMLYATSGDATQPNLAQDLSSLAGKTLRITPEGGIPSDNPYGTAVWSYGHRNAQGIAWDSVGRLWQTEHGPTGEFELCCRDELNLIERGANYGWPAIKGEETREGMRRSVRHSGNNSTWAPAGIGFVDGSLFFAGLRGSTLYEARLSDQGGIVEFKEHLTDRYGRLRAVTVGPDGFLYISTSNRDSRGTIHSGDDKILKVHKDFLR